MATSPPTPDDFEKLLLHIHPDRERAGEAYEFLRLKLLEYFRSRACLHAEELADEVFNRLTRKIVAGEEIRDVLRYCYGLARWVWTEYLKKPDLNHVSFDELPVVPFVVQESLVRKEREACIRHCLQSLSAGDRDLIIEYWDHDDRSNREARRALAERRQMTMTALRIRICRIKDKLDACLADCLNHGVPKNN